MHERLLFTEAYGSEKHRFFVKSKGNCILTYRTSLLVHLTYHFTWFIDEQSITELLSDTTRAKSFYFGFISIVKEVFLPQGYPDSVHPDYTPYQIWDTVQVSLHKKVTLKIILLFINEVRSVLLFLFIIGICKYHNGYSHDAFYHARGRCR